MRQWKVDLIVALPCLLAGGLLASRPERIIGSVTLSWIGLLFVGIGGLAATTAVYFRLYHRNLEYEDVL